MVCNFYPTLMVAYMRYDDVRRLFGTLQRKDSIFVSYNSDVLVRNTDIDMGHRLVVFSDHNPTDDKQ